MVFVVDDVEDDVEDDVDDDVDDKVATFATDELDCVAKHLITCAFAVDMTIFWVQIGQVVKRDLVVLLFVLLRFEDDNVVVLGAKKEAIEDELEDELEERFLLPVVSVKPMEPMEPADGAFVQFDIKFADLFFDSNSERPR